jgi:hypothetical protein
MGLGTSLVNYFPIREGVRGTLCYLCYFVLVANFLQSIINKAKNDGSTASSIV